MKQHIKLYEDFVNEGTVKTFEMDVKSVIDHIKKGMGWIDPGYIEETWNELANSVDFSIAAEEIADRLIKAGLVYHEGNDGEKGKQVRSYKEISSLVNEARFEANKSRLVNEGHDGYMDKAPGSTREEATKKLQSWIDDDDDGQFRLFRGVKWVGSTTEDRLDSLATKYEDEYIVLGEVGGELTYAYWRRS